MKTTEVNEEMVENQTEKVDKTETDKLQ